MKSEKKYRRRLVNALDRNPNDDRGQLVNVDRASRTEYDDGGNRGGLFRLFAIILLLALVATTDFKQWKSIKWGKDSLQFVQNLLIQNESQKKIEKREIVFLTPEVSDLPGITLPLKDKNTNFAKYLNAISISGYSQQFKMFQIHAFYNAGIPVSYLSEMKKYGYLESYPFAELIAFYNSGIDASYLNSLKDTGLLTKLSFVDIIRTKRELQHKG
ncbi:MAG TPA: hypothetical protein VKA34_04710 [Balneolales bacterium]|nr:hypothetical protein [Balneolales bacterium]